MIQKDPFIAELLLEGERRGKKQTKYIKDDFNSYFSVVYATIFNVHIESFLSQAGPTASWGNFL